MNEQEPMINEQQPTETNEQAGLGQPFATLDFSADEILDIYLALGVALRVHSSQPDPDLSQIERVISLMRVMRPAAVTAVRSARGGVNG